VRGSTSGGAARLYLGGRELAEEARDMVHLLELTLR
jgi:hypothetical protein